MPGGRIIIEIQCPHAVDVPLALVAEAKVGLVSYEAWAAVQAVDCNRQSWSMTYRAMIGDALLDEQSTEYTCWTISGTELLAEAFGAGLVGEEVGDLVIMRPK